MSQKKWLDQGIWNKFCYTVWNFKRFCNREHFRTSK